MPLDPCKVALAYPNYIEKSTLTGGSYSMLLPLSNAKNRVLARRARTTDLLPSSTQFSINFDKARATGSLCIASHNFSTGATIRVRVYADSMQTILLYDSDVIQVWSAVFDSVQDLEWEFDNYWYGTVDEDDRESFTPLFTLFFDPVIAMSVKVEVFDELNMAGYLEFGRVFTSNLFQPEINMDFGVQFGYLNTTDIETALDTTEYFDVRRQKRTMSFVLGNLSEVEAFNKLYTLKRDLGVDGEILVAYNLQQTSQVFIQRTFLARNQSVDAISQPQLSTYSTALNFVEIL